MNGDPRDNVPSVFATIRVIAGKSTLTAQLERASRV